MNDQEKIEELAEAFSFKLAAKLRSGQTTPEKMALSIEKFLASANSQTEEELKKIIRSL